LYLPLNLAECVARAHEIHLRQMPRRLDCHLNLTRTDDFFVSWRLSSKFVCCWWCYWSSALSLSLSLSLDWSSSNQLPLHDWNFAKLSPPPPISFSRSCCSSQQRQYAALRVKEGVECLRASQHASACVSMRQHTSAYVSIRQHTSAYVSIRQHLFRLGIRQHTSTRVQHTPAYASIRQHTPAYVSIRQAIRAC
jgi:hypothetical protein